MNQDQALAPLQTYGFLPCSASLLGRRGGGTTQEGAEYTDSGNPKVSIHASQPPCRCRGRAKVPLGRLTQQLSGEKSGEGRTMTLNKLTGGYPGRARTLTKQVTWKLLKFQERKEAWPGPSHCTGLLVPRVSLCPFCSS